MQKGKFWVFVGVMAMHAVVIALFNHSLRHSEPRRSKVYYSTWIASDPQQAKETPQRAKPRKTNVDKFEQKRSAPDRVAPIKNKDDVPLMDWRAIGGESIRAAIDRMESNPPLGSGEKKPVQKDEQQPALFSAPLYRSGDTNRLDDGEVNTWLDSRCYATNRPYISDPDNPNQLRVVCKGNVGKPKADDQMFDHLRPDYLQDRSTVTP